MNFSVGYTIFVRYIFVKDVVWMEAGPSSSQKQNLKKNRIETAISSNYSKALPAD
ncbi:MAG: hypothetical protein QM644_09545 [Mobilitalea sp.]